ncbi:MAG: bifunctional class I SAM-dependent methyltransferase/GNAT family N-acetyltransferase [Planctomycetota bacterium]
MASTTPVLDAHRLRLVRALADFVHTLGPREVLEVGCGDGALVRSLRAKGRNVRGVELDEDLARSCAEGGLDVVRGDGASLEDGDRSIDVVVLRDVLSCAEDPAAVAAEAWRVARRCVVIVEPEYAAGLPSQAMMEWLDALVDELRFSSGQPALHALTAGEILDLFPDRPGVVETRGFGILTSAPPDEIDAIVARAAGAGTASEVQLAQAAALREDAGRGDITYPGSRVLVAFRPDAIRDDVEDEPDPVETAEGEVTLREIALDDAAGVFRIHPRPSQQRFVAPNVISLAQAALTPHAWFRGVYVGDTAVGFVMVSTDPDDAESPYLWRFMIDARHQGRGVGRRALNLVCEHFAAQGAEHLHASITEGPGSPRPFYESLGFVDTGRVEDGETVLRRDITVLSGQNA